MRVRILSDLHLEFGGWLPPEVDSDVVILAGDIWKRDLGVWWACQHFSPERLIMLAGNHEHYDGEYGAVIEACRTAAAELGCHFLENDVAVLDGVRFLGATLWTDFCLNGDGDVQRQAMATASAMMSDYRVIEWDEAGRRRRLQPAGTVALHHASRRFLEEELARNFSGKTVVVTHHLPCRQSIAARYRGDPLNPAFCSDLRLLIETTQPDLWIHGHTHDSCDYRVDRTRVVCNPRGYFPDGLNATFDPTCIVEI